MASSEGRDRCVDHDSMTGRSGEGMQSGLAGQGIDSLGLRPRIGNVLLRAGVRTIAHLLERSEFELLKISGLGPLLVNEIKSSLAPNGLYLADKPGPPNGVRLWLDIPLNERENSSQLPSCNIVPILHLAVLRVHSDEQKRKLRGPMCEAAIAVKKAKYRQCRGKAVPGGNLCLIHQPHDPHNTGRLPEVESGLPPGEAYRTEGLVALYLRMMRMPRLPSGWPNVEPTTSSIQAALAIRQILMTTEGLIPALNEGIKRALSALKPKLPLGLTVIERRYGLIGPRETCSAIARDYGIRSTRISQIESRALARLRDLKGNRLAPDDLFSSGEEQEPEPTESSSTEAPESRVLPFVRKDIQESI